MKRYSIGYIHCDRKPGPDEKAFIKQAKKRNINLIMFNISKRIDQRELQRKIKKCKIIFNNSGEDYAYEFVKTLEELGKKVVDSSRAYYFIEDKWMFSLECYKHKIPSPQTILLSENIQIAKEELEAFRHWPVVLKRIYGTQGEYVAKADNLEQAEKIMEKFWKKGSDRIPIVLS